MNFIPVNTPLLSGNEKKYLNECIETAWISSEGDFVRRFEDGMAAYVGRKYGIAVCNGTVAIDLALDVLELSEGDEVILPTFTIISCIAGMIRKGIKPVLVDSDIDTWTMDVSQIEDKITSKTKAIMVVHMYGMPVDMDPVIELAKRYGLYIIEDAAEAHGLKYKDKCCGSFGDITCMSFYPNKHITTGEGGMVLMDDEKLRDRANALRNLCHIPGQRFHHEELGYNYRMSNIQAAVGLAQLEEIDNHITIKRELGLHYQELFKHVSGIQLPVSKTEYAENVYWVFGIVLEPEIPMDASDMINALADVGIGCRPFFYPMHQQPVFKKMGLFKNEEYPIAEKLGTRGFYVPSGLTVDGGQRKYIASQLIDIIKGNL